MSNLYKQYWVTNQQENARVINANALLEERLSRQRERQLAEQRRQQELAGCFEAGIVRADTEVIEDITEEETIDLTEQAREEAERIKAEAESVLSEAQAQAQDILTQAKFEAERICKEAQAQGYADGDAKAQQELGKAYTRLENEYSVKSNQLERDYITKRDNMENELVDVILEVFNKVFHIQFDTKKQILMHLINTAILNIEGERKFRIKVADSNVMFLENHREDILERVGHGIELEFIADSAMNGNDCLIETDSGVFDCSLDMQLENLIKDIRSLSS